MTFGVTHLVQLKKLQFSLIYFFQMHMIIKNFYEYSAALEATKITFLQCELNSLKFFGSPYQKYFEPGF